MTRHVRGGAPPRRERIRLGLPPSGDRTGRCQNARMTPFVGRTAELDSLLALVALAARERCPVAGLVVGEPGSGKTRLLAEVVARTSPMRTMRIVGFQPVQPIPLVAVGDLLRELARVPGIGGRLDRLVFGSPAEQASEALQVFEAAHRALSALGTILLIIDDLQWVDDQSLALVQYLLRAADSTRRPLAVIAASRPSASASALRDALAAGAPVDRRAQLELGPLPREEGVALARSLRGTLDDRRAEDVWRRAAGSPFWVEALVRLEGSDDPSDLLRHRFRGLSGEGGTLLAALAVGARPFLVDEIAEVLDIDREAVVFLARELVSAGLAVERSGTLRLAHDLIRESAAAELPPPARRRLHARFAEWIEASAADDLASLREALVHRDAAGLPTAAVALRLVAASGSRLLAADDLALLASIADRLPPGSSDQVRLDTGLAELAAVLAYQDLAMARWERVSETSADGAARQHAELGAARAAYRLGRSRDAQHHLARARAAAEPSAVTAIRLDALDAEVRLWLDHDTAAGHAAAERALARAQEMGAAAGGAEHLAPNARAAFVAAAEAAGDAALQRDRPDELVRLGNEILRVARHSDEESHLSALMRVGFSLRPLGYAEESRASFQEAWEIAHRAMLPVAMVEAGHGLARSLRDLGRLAEAHAVVAETADLESRIRNAPRRWGSARSILHTVELLLGDPNAALRALQEDAATEPDPHYRLGIREAIAAWMARARGEEVVEAVAAELAAARSDSTAAGCPRCAAELAVVSSELLARVGRVEEARQQLADWGLGQTGTYRQRDLWRWRAEASIATAAGDEALAVSLLERLADGLGAAGMLPDLFWARLDLGRILMATDRARAIDAFSEAAGIAERTGARNQARIAAMLLRRAGVRAWRRPAAQDGARGPEDLDGLSPREREVADLLARGRSNREIAEALVVSPKTVERHVTNILAKLGLRNRTELAAVAANAGTVRVSPDD